MLYKSTIIFVIKENVEMVFSEALFLVLFLPAVLISYFLFEISYKCKKLFYKLLKREITFERQAHRNYKNSVLLISSLIFYAWGEPKFVLVMIGSIIINYLLGLMIDKNREKAKIYFFLSVLINVAILFVFKYLVFTIENLNHFFGQIFIVYKIGLPIGISFFTFQIMSYIADVYNKTAPVQKNLFSLALYISMFAQLVAGPIVRYQTIAHEINERNENIDDFSNGTVRFIEGLTKKVIIGDHIALIADSAFQCSTTELGVISAWIGALAYTLQIYFDFSGYSDMAIGLGRMFGFHFLENFNYPYISKSITEFWRRWHISLSTWFRDYVYFPIGGSRVNSKVRHLFNLGVVWLLTGIWHGANWTFVVWGLYYYILLVIEKLTGLDKKNSKLVNILGHVYTIYFFMISWVIFRADNINHAIEYLKVMHGKNGLGEIPESMSVISCLLLLVGVIFSTPVLELAMRKIQLQTENNVLVFKNKFYSILYASAFIIIFALVFLFVSTSSYSPFIYFNF